MILKDFEAKIEVKAPSEDSPFRDVVAIISVEEEDRDGDIIDVKGIDISAYERNPVVLWNHDHGIPIARNIAMGKSGNDIMATARFPEEGISEKADEVYGLIKAGVINATSIGFMPDFDEMDERKADNSPWGTGYNFKQSELLEYSFVSVPSNRSALVQQRSFLAENLKGKPQEAKSNESPTATTEPPPTTPQEKPVDKLIELRAKRADLLEQLEKHLTEFDAAELPEEIAKQVDDLQAEMTTLDETIGRLEKFEALKASKAVPTKERAFRDENHGHVEVEAKSWLGKADRDPEKGIRFGQLARAVAAGKGNPRDAGEWAKQAFGESHPVSLQLQKTLVNDPGNTPFGGLLVPEDWASEIIELLRNETVVRRMGPSTVGMPFGNLTLPKQGATATSGYVGENTAIQASDATFAELKMAAKKIAAVTSMSNELLNYNAYGADAIVRDDLVAGQAVAEDAQLLRGTATSTAPTSLLEIATNASSTVAMPTGGTQLYNDVDSGLGQLELILLNSNVSTGGAYVLMAPRTFTFLQNLRDGNGNKVYPEIGQNMLRGHSVLVSNQIPINLGVGTDESEIYLVQPRHVLIGDTRRMDMMTTQHGNITYNGTDFISTFSNDLTAFRLISEHDMNVRHDTCVAVLTGVTWAP